MLVLLRVFEIYNWKKHCKINMLWRSFGVSPSPPDTCIMMAHDAPRPAAANALRVFHWCALSHVVSRQRITSVGIFAGISGQ